MATFVLPPADPKDRSPAFEEAWDDEVRRLLGQVPVSDFQQFYDPTASDAPSEPGVAIARWPAFPRQLLRPAVSPQSRWHAADNFREFQDEYCEWAVERPGEGEGITAVTFTTEVPEYWEQLARHNKARFLELCREHVGREVAIDEFFDGDEYVRENDPNMNTPGRILHLAVGPNNLFAALALAAQATVLRARNGTPVTHPQDFVCCANLGEPLRGSDPQIAIKVNRSARQGADVSLQEPLGLYIDELRTSAIKTPDDTDATEFWHVERGTPTHTLRARFEVRDKPYGIGDLTIDDHKIEFGAQLADLVTVKITALAANAGKHSPTPDPCEREDCPELPDRAS